MAAPSVPPPRTSEPPAPLQGCFQSPSTRAVRSQLRPGAPAGFLADGAGLAGPGSGRRCSRGSRGRYTAPCPPPLERDELVAPRIDVERGLPASGLVRPAVRWLLRVAG